MANCKESKTHGYPHTHVDRLTPTAQSSSCHHGFCPSSPRKLTRRLLPLNAMKTRWWLCSFKWLRSRAKSQGWAGEKPRLPAAPLFSASSGFSSVAADRQDTGPEGEAADGRKRDRLEVGVERAVRIKRRWSERERRWRNKSGVYQLGQSKISSEGRGVTAMKAALGQRMGGRGGRRMCGFSSCGERLGPPRSGRGGGVDFGGGRSRGRGKKGREFAWSLERRWGGGGGAKGRGSFKQLNRPELWALAVLRSLTWHNLVTVSLRVYARTEWEEGKGSAKITIIIYGNSGAESRGRASTAPRPTVKGRKRTKNAEKQLLAKTT